MATIFVPGVVPHQQRTDSGYDFAARIRVSAREMPTRCYPAQRLSGGMRLIAAANVACASRSTGRCRISLEAGFSPRQLPPFQLRAGLIGRGKNPPPQFGHTLSSTVSAQSAQKVHSNEQMRASSESGGNALLQCSHVGLSCSIPRPLQIRPVMVSAHRRQKVAPASAQIMVCGVRLPATDP